MSIPSGANEGRPMEREPARQLQARLRASGEVVPESRQDSTLVDANNAPEFVVGSAEGVATFQGFNGQNPQPHAEKWLQDRFDEMEKTNSEQHGGGVRGASGWVRKRLHRDQ